uniref:B-cell receptor CD22-like n=1 Tax=Monopterus albus TaxID=43700 RepID=UPI0009B36E0C
CNRVTYTVRTICAFRGSSVDISCTYNSFGSVTSKFWFSPERSHRWQRSSQPEDLSRDSQYAGRVQVLETKTGRSTLRITDLRESDSAQYRFTFNLSNFEFGNSLPGTTLTVTDPALQVVRVTAHQSHTEVELKCHSRCSPAARPSYVWFKNGKEIMNQQSFSYTGQFDPGDGFSCALKGHEDHASPSVYPPKPPSVSVSPSAEVEEGSSVTLTCSSDANPAANYTWYKEKEESPKASGQNFTITDFRPEHSGNYSCEVQNRRGRHSPTVHLTVAGVTGQLPFSYTHCSRGS